MKQSPYQRAISLKYKYKANAQRQEHELAVNSVYNATTLIDLLIWYDVPDEKNHTVITAILMEINRVKADDWRNTLLKRRVVKNAIKKVLEENDINPRAFAYNNTMLYEAVFEAIVNDKNIK